MRIAIIGGIYGKSAKYRGNFRSTPETILESALRARGVEVSTFSHYARIDGHQFEIIHVHHLSWGAVRVALDPSKAAFVFTTHDGPAMAGVVQAHRNMASTFAVRRADALIALSSPEADFQRANYPVEGALHCVIANGVDPALYPMRRTNKRGAAVPWQILYVGQLIEIKRVDLLLQAVARLARPFRLKLAYQNSKLEPNLRELAGRLSIAGSVEFLGARNPEQLAALYNDADLFVLPSSGEALPTVVTEAMLTGTPVLATDVGGVRGQLGGFGVIVPPDNLEVLTRALVEVFSNYDRVAACSSTMADYARKNFSTEAMVQKHIEVYEKLAHDKDRRRHRAGLRLSNIIAGKLMVLAPRRSPDHAI